jgi:hypothetical protein
MNRTPPAGVLRELRKEVGFGCPVPGCGNPYLYWHHFDPPWNEKEHHDPNGMIALCGEHHPKADAGAFTKEQLREFKQSGKSRAMEVKGRFDWMRRDLLAVVGGCMYLRVPVILEFRNEPAIWFNRDDEGYLLLNFRMLTTSGQARVRIEDNFWMPRGNPDEVESPPNGRKLRVCYNNGDSLSVEFFDVASAEDLFARYPSGNSAASSTVQFPVTAVDVSFSVGGTEVSFTPDRTVLPGFNQLIGGFFADCRVGIALG